MHKIIEKTILAKDSFISLFDALIYIIENNNISNEDAAKIIKKNKVFLRMLKQECQKNKLIKEK